MASETRAPSEPRNPEVHYEHTDLSARMTVGIIVGTLIGVWIFSAFVYLYFAYLAHNRAASSPPPLPIEAHGNPMPPQPRLQDAPHEDLKAMRAHEDWMLNHYAWVNKSKGVVSIPIDRAIRMLAQRGIAPQKAPANLALSQPQAGTRLTGFEGKVEPEPR